MRLAAISAAVLVTATCIAVAQEGATSQGNIGPTPQASRQPATVGAAVLPAPTGHRQPHLSDLPPDAIRREQMDDQSRSDDPPRGDGIDPQLRICRGC